MNPYFDLFVLFFFVVLTQVIINAFVHYRFKKTSAKIKSDLAEYKRLYSKFESMFEKLDGKKKPKHDFSDHSVLKVTEAIEGLKEAQKNRKAKEAESKKSYKNYHSMSVLEITRAVKSLEEPIETKKEKEIENEKTR